MSSSETARPKSPLIALPKPLAPPPRFLAPNATPAQLLRATAANHQKWFERGAISLTLSQAGSSITWLCKQEEIIIPFPRLTGAIADARLDHVVADCRKRAPQQVGCWSLLPSQPHDLGARLCARGFEWGWQPHWMALDLHTMRADFPTPEGLHTAVDDVGDWEVKDLPYYAREGAGALHLKDSPRSRRIWHLGAWLNGVIVGHSVLHLTTGPSGVAGIYNVGVVPSARRQGVGRAITLAACQFAQALGCHYATLNAATDIYERLGFVSLGRGQTWWMHTPALTALPPTREQIVFAEAVGRGDLKTLAALDPAMLPADLEAPLPCGMTPLDLAVKTNKPASVNWLVKQGASLDILHAWDLGWKETAARLLAEQPEHVNRRSGAWQLTPLHQAVERNDIELARLLLSAHPDLHIQDTQFHGTPSGWARHLGRTEIIALLESHPD